MCNNSDIGSVDRFYRIYWKRTEETKIVCGETFTNALESHGYRQCSHLIRYWEEITFNNNKEIN